MPIRSQMSSIVGQTEPEHPELFALELGKIAETDFVYINQHQTLSKTSVCDCKILKEFNYEYNQERIVRVICPLFKKNLYLTSFTLYHLQI